MSKFARKHDWVSLKRDCHAPEDMTLNDLFEEVRCAVGESDVRTLAFMLDEGRYADFGRRIALLLRYMRMVDGPSNKTAPSYPKRGQTFP